MSQQEMADRMCVTQQTISSWERGLTYPDIESVEKMCQILEIREDELFEEGRKFERQQRIVNPNLIALAVIGLLLLGGLTLVITSRYWRPGISAGDDPTISVAETTLAESETTVISTTESNIETVAPTTVIIPTFETDLIPEEWPQVYEKDYTYGDCAYSIQREGGTLYYEYQGKRTSLAEGCTEVKTYEEIDFDNDLEPELLIIVSAGARGSQNAYIIDGCDDQSLLIHDLNADMPTYTCYLLEGFEAHIINEAWNEDFIQYVTSADANYFWDKNGAFVQNEYYKLDENGNYAVNSWFQETSISFGTTEDDKGEIFIFSRDMNMTLGSGASLLMTCYERYIYTDNSFVLVYRLYQ